MDSVDVAGEHDPLLVVPALHQDTADSVARRGVADYLIQHLPVEGQQIFFSGPDKEPHHLVVDPVVQLDKCLK